MEALLIQKANSEEKARKGMGKMGKEMEILEEKLVEQGKRNEEIVRKYEKEIGELREYFEK